MRSVLALFCLAYLSTAVVAGPGEPRVASIASDFFQIYAERRDFDAFMNFYDENVAFSDIIYDAHYTGKAQLRDFFDWSRGYFRVIEGDVALTVKNQIISGQTAVSYGTFHRFTYEGRQYGPWDFVIWQEFSTEGKIVRQDDWINYTPKKLLFDESNQN